MTIKEIIIKWAQTYIHEPTKTIFRAYPLTETEKAIGVMVLRDATEFKEYMKKKHGKGWKKEYEEFLERNQMIEIDNFHGSYEPLWWLPKSQIKFNNICAVIPHWLAKKYNLHEISPLPFPLVW